MAANAKQLHHILWSVFITEDLVLDETEDQEIEHRQRLESEAAVVSDDLREQ